MQAITFIVLIKFQYTCMASAASQARRRYTWCFWVLTISYMYTGNLLQGLKVLRRGVDRCWPELVASSFVHQETEQTAVQTVL